MKYKKLITNYMKQTPRKALFVLVTLLTITGLATVALASFGPDRPTKQYYDGVPGFDHVTFNSFTNVPNIGDERNFFTGKIAGAPGGFFDPVTTNDGDELLLRVYVHNGADEKYNASGKGVAKNTQVRAEIPNVLSKNQEAKAYISADNAQPQQIWDTLNINSDKPYKLKYIPGSAKVTNNKGEFPLSDNIVTTGAQIGWDQMNGSLPGCFEFVALVTFKVKVSSPDIDIEKTVRKEGAKDWVESTKVNPSDTVEYRLRVKNISETTITNVLVGDNLPPLVSYVANSTYMYDSNYPNGVKLNEGLTTGGLNINSSAPGGVAYILFKAKVADKSKTDKYCDAKNNISLINWGVTKADGTGTWEDSAEILIPCDKPPVPVYSCDALSAVKLSKDTFKFTAKASAQDGAEIVGYKYDFGDGSAKFETDKNTVEHKYAKPGEYTAQVWALVKVDGKVQEVTSDNCKTKVKVDDKPVTPIFECTALSVEQLARDKFKFTVTYTTEGKVTLSKIVYNFGDGTEPFHTDKTVVEHTYAAPGNYDVTAKLLFNVDGQTKEDICTAKVQVQPLEQPPVTPPAKELPNTGIGSVLAGFFGTSALGMGIRSWLLSRRALRSSLLGK